MSVIETTRGRRLQWIYQREYRDARYPEWGIADACSQEAIGAGEGCTMEHVDGMGEVHWDALPAWMVIV